MSKKNSGVDKDLIRDLAAILNDTDLTEIEVEQDELRIRVSRQGSGQTYQVAAPVAAPASAPPSAAPSNPIAADASSGSSGMIGSNAVKSPMVGTAYHSPAPGAQPFVKVGDKVAEGQTVMIIEAMKTMNQIHAPRSGTVTALHVEDQQPVEYGEPLLSIE